VPDGDGGRAEDADVRCLEASGPSWRDYRQPALRSRPTEKLAANAHVLVVAPDLVTGLTHAELDRVEDWLQSSD
jgi:hypothetical protein